MAKHMQKTKPKWTNNAMQEAVRAFEEEMSVRRAAPAEKNSMKKKRINV
jgi:hypothetical protein